ncbi:MAG: phosphoribosylanthranilate isomerase [Oscillospiraceae bacterium]|nr:phosphoribosylanthranilate isomerase [Oscillospiraceae bacterium]
MIKVKICGLSRICDIEAVNCERPDYIGFVFAESRRKVTPEQAATLRVRLLPDIVPVGVFVDETIEHILRLIDEDIIDVVQLHGSEDETYIQNLKRLTNKTVIKAITIQHKGDVQKWEKTAADYLLLDHKGGGTGQRFDWDLIGAVDKPYFLAGGLNLDNITQAMQKRTLYALDVSSGVETHGMKDPIKIKAFIRRARDEQ